jgi:predicted hydrocarbon binding protein
MDLQYRQVNKDYEAGEMISEEQAREIIDDVLETAGWKVQDYRNLDLSAGRGVAVRYYEIPAEVVQQAAKSMSGEA